MDIGLDNQLIEGGKMSKLGARGIIIRQNIKGITEEQELVTGHRKRPNNEQIILDSQAT